jgi:hypothetical protein
MEQEDNGWGFYVVIDEPTTTKSTISVYKKQFNTRPRPNPYDKKRIISTMGTIPEEDKDKDEDEDHELRLHFELNLGFISSESDFDFDFDLDLEEGNKKGKNTKNTTKEKNRKDSSVISSFCFILIMATVTCLLK